MSEHRGMLNKMNKIEIYVANEDTDINPSVQEAIEYVLKQNDPVGTVAGYYDEKLTIWSVSNYFLQLLGWDDLDEFMKASDGSMLSVFCNEQKHVFSPERLHDLQGSHILYLTDSKGLSIPVRTMMISISFYIPNSWMPGIIKDGQSGYYLPDLITLPGIRKQRKLLFTGLLQI